MKPIILFLLTSLFSFTQAQTLFMRTYGGPADNDRLYHGIEALGGGFIYSGMNRSFGAGNDRDGILMKTDPSGNLIWAYNYGTSAKNEFFISTWQAPDSSIYAFGTQNQTGSRDHLIIAKFDKSGQLLWDRMIGGMASGYDEQPRKIIGYDNHIYLFGSTRDTPNMGQANGYVLKLGMAGNKIWANALGENGEEQIRSAVLGANGNFKCAGFINSIGGGNFDFMMCEVDTSGNLIWMKSYGTSALEWADAGLELSDGTLLAGGFQETNGQRDIYIIRTSATGTLLWAKTFGGTGDEHCYSMTELPNGDIACVGYSDSYGSGDDNAIILTINPQGQVVKGLTYGGSMDETAFNSELLADQTLLISGWSNSPGYTQGMEDFFVIKASLGIAGEKFCPHQLVTGLIQDSLITVQVDSAGRTVASFLEKNLMLDHVSVTPVGEAICLRITALGEEKFPFLQISPNPAVTILNISGEKNLFRQAIYNVYDISGKRIMHGKVAGNEDSFQLDVSHLPQGIYVLSLQNDKGESWQEKWVKISK